MTYPNIALVGKKRSGKDTIADHLVKNYGYTRIAFADPVRDLALAIDPLVPPNFACNQIRLSHLVQDVGWDRAKEEYPEVRRILRNVGEGVVAQNPYHWIDLASAAWNGVDGPVVITDVRRIREAKACRNTYFGATLWRIRRPSTEDPNDDHVTETELEQIKCDKTIMNVASVHVLHLMVDELMRAYRP